MIATVLAEGQHQRITSARMNMAFGQKIRARRQSWDVAPGYGDRRPSANRFSVQTGLPDRAHPAIAVERNKTCAGTTTGPRATFPGQSAAANAVVGESALIELPRGTSVSGGLSTGQDDQRWRSRASRPVFRLRYRTERAVLLEK